MFPSWWQILVGALALSLYALLLMTMFGRMRRVFPLFLAFVAFSLASEMVGWTLILSGLYVSEPYTHFYFITSGASLGLLLIVVARIYWTVRNDRDFSHWVGLGIFAFLMLATGLNHRTRVEFTSDAYVLFQFVALSFLVSFVIITYLQVFNSKRTVLGRNYSGVLYGVTFLLAFQLLDFSFYHFSILGTQEFLGILQMVSVVPWLIFIWAFRTEDAPAEIPSLSPPIRHRQLSQAPTR